MAETTSWRPRFVRSRQGCSEQKQSDLFVVARWLSKTPAFIERVALSFTDKSLTSMMIPC